jgi:hypothetical protein
MVMPWGNTDSAHLAQQTNRSLELTGLLLATQSSPLNKANAQPNKQRNKRTNKQRNNKQTNLLATQVQEVSHARLT